MYVCVAHSGSQHNIVKRVFEETCLGNVSLTRNKRSQGLRSPGRGHFYRIRANVRAQQESGYHYKFFFFGGEGGLTQWVHWSYGSLCWSGVLGSEYSSSIRTCPKMTGQRIASAQLLLAEGTLKVGFLMTRENVSLEVVSPVEARFTTRILAFILLRRRLWEVEVVWVLYPRRRAYVCRMGGMHVRTWSHRSLERVLRERERIRLHSFHWCSTNIKGAEASK